MKCGYDERDRNQRSGTDHRDHVDRDRAAKIERSNHRTLFGANRFANLACHGRERAAHGALAGDG